MRGIKIALIGVGLALLGVVLAETDLDQVWSLASGVGWGLAVVLGLYFAGFLIDSFTWQMALVAAPLNGVWLYRLWKVRMVGEVFNSVVPAAGMGGEPVKAALLKRHYGIGYREGTASLILAKTINLIALVVFLAVGFAMMLGTDALATAHKAVAGAGLAAIATGTSLAFAVQRLRLASAAGAWASRWHRLRRLDEALHHLRDMDERLVQFYTRRRSRLMGAVVLAFVNWIVGAFEIFYTLLFIGHPVTITDAWIIEAVAQLVRTATFFIPASLGAQEGAFLVICAAVTGSPSVGVAVALVRRLRELLWLVWGAAVGSIFTLRAAAGGGDGPPGTGRDGVSA